MAKDIVGLLRGGEILALVGDLGSGKTTFTQFLAKELGVKENVTSPTFVLMKKYKIEKLRKQKNKKIKRYLYHLDAYRLSSPDEALDLGLEEIWSDPKNITVIEWADRIADILPEKRIEIAFSLEKERKVMVNF